MLKCAMSSQISLWQRFEKQVGITWGGLKTPTPIPQFQCFLFNCTRIGSSHKYFLRATQIILAETANVENYLCQESFKYLDSSKKKILKHFNKGNFCRCRREVLLGTIHFKLKNDLVRIPTENLGFGKFCE